LRRQDKLLQLFGEYYTYTQYFMRRIWGFRSIATSRTISSPHWRNISKSGERTISRELIYDFDRQVDSSAVYEMARPGIHVQFSENAEDICIGYNLGKSFLGYGER